MKSKTTKGIAVLLACFLGMAAVGCSGDNDSSSKNSDAAEVSAATLPVETDAQGEAVTDASGNEVLASGATDFMVKEMNLHGATRMALATAVRMLPKQPTATAMPLLPQQAALPTPQHRQTATLPLPMATLLPTATATMLLTATAKSLPLMQQ